MALWYYETVDFSGRWSPRTAPDEPQFALQGGHARQKTANGIGARIRHIVEVPAGLSDLSPMDLQRHFWGACLPAAVDPRPGTYVT